MPSFMRSPNFLSVLFVLIGTIALGDDVPLANEGDLRISSDAESQTIVQSAEIGDIDVSSPVYQSYTNEQLSDKLNQFHLLSAQERRELLLEVSRRIERDGQFKVAKNEQRFGQVVSIDRKQESSSQEEPVLEEIIIVRTELNEDDVDAVRAKEVRKPRAPTPRVSSGRAYSSQ